jgi:hypothetical protein
MILFFWEYLIWFKILLSGPFGFVSEQSVNFFSSSASKGTSLSKNVAAKANIDITDTFPIVSGSI